MGVKIQKRTDFSETIYTVLSVEHAACMMREKGYRQVSRKFCMVARIDLQPEAFRRFMAKELGSPETKEPDWSDFEYYRRCCSPDTIENVPEEIMCLIRAGSG